jgi:hypothetical protein
MPGKQIPEPWKSFLKEIDDSIGSEVSFHCFGGFAIKLLFGLPRETSDVDVMAAVIRDQYAELLDLAGKDSALHNKHKVHLDLVGAIAVVPDDYQKRLIPITSTGFKKIRLYVMEPHDIVLAKLGRDHPKDIQDVEYLAQVAKLDTDLLRERYRTELSHNVIGPPKRMVGRLEYWIGVIEERRR